MSQLTISLHAQLRHFSEKLQEEEMSIYQEMGIDMPYRWHMILQILANADKPITISELADLQFKTHPDVVYTVNQMAKEGLVEELTDATDKRKRLLSPSQKAIVLIQTLKPTWQAIHDAMQNLIKEVAPDIWLNLESLNHTLEEKSFYQRIRLEKKKSDFKFIRLVTHQEIKNHIFYIQRFWNQFKSKYFNVDEIETTIHNINALLAKNEASIYYCQWSEEIVGCICLLRRSFQYGEVIYFYVAEEYRRKFIGTKLLDKITSTAKDLGMGHLIVQSHPKLVAVNYILRQNGFSVQDNKPGSIAAIPGLPIVLEKII